MIISTDTEKAFKNLMPFHDKTIQKTNNRKEFP